MFVWFFRNVCNTKLLTANSRKLLIEQPKLKVEEIILTAYAGTLVNEKNNTNGLWWNVSERKFILTADAGTLVKESD